jgi:hypothetical protein
MNAPQATAHSSRPAPAPDPRPVIKGTALPRAPEPRQCEWLITGFCGGPVASNQFKGLVDRPENFVAVQSGNHALDLPPVAKANHITLSAAALGTRGSFERGGLAISVDQLGRVSERQAAMDEDSVHGRPGIARGCFPTADKCRQRAANQVPDDDCVASDSPIGSAVAWGASS